MKDSYLKVNVIVKINLIYKSFHHLYILLKTNFGSTYLKVLAYGTKVE